MHQAVLQL